MSATLQFHTYVLPNASNEVVFVCSSGHLETVRDLVVAGSEHTLLIYAGVYRPSSNLLARVKQYQHHNIILNAPAYAMCSPLHDMLGDAVPLNPEAGALGLNTFSEVLVAPKVRARPKAQSVLARKSMDLRGAALIENSVTDETILLLEDFPAHSVELESAKTFTYADFRSNWHRLSFDLADAIAQHYYEKACAAEQLPRGASRKATELGQSIIRVSRFIPPWMSHKSPDVNLRCRNGLITAGIRRFDELQIASALDLTKANNVGLKTLELLLDYMTTLSLDTAPRLGFSDQAEADLPGKAKPRLLVGEGSGASA